MKKKILLFASCIASLGFAQAQAPVARWTFNDGTANNDAGTIAHGTIANAVEALSYNGTKAFDFNGNDAKISFDNNFNSTLSDSTFTISLWAKPRAAADKEGNRSVLMAKWVSTGEPNNGFILWIDGFDTQASSSVNDPNSVSFPAPQLNVWHHYVVQQNRDSLTIFIDNKPVAISKNFRYNANDKELSLGALYTNSYNFDGKIDEVQLFDRCVSRSEVDSLYKLMPTITTFSAADVKLKKDSSALPDVTVDPFYDLSEFCTLISLNPEIASVNDTGLITAHKIGSTSMVVATINGTLRDTFTVYVPDTTMFAYYNFENNVADDRSFNGYNGTIIKAEPTSNRFGQASAALLFGSVDKSVNVKDVDLRGSQISIATWIYVNNFQTDVNHISSIVGLYQNGWCGLRIGDADWAENNRAQIVLGNQNGTQWVRLKTKTELQTKQYYHIVATYDGATVKLYINGVLDTATAYSQKITTFGTMEIGASANERPLDGSIDEVRLYRHAISAHEVDSLFSIVPFSKIELAENTVSLPIDSSYTPQYTTVPQCDLSKFIRYSVSDNSIASIENGKVTALQKGETTVTIETLNKTIKTSFTVVVTKPATAVLLNKQSLSLQVSTGEQLNASVAPSDASNTEVEYTSSNTTVAQVSPTGMVTAIAAGQALIIATHKQNAKLADTCTVTVSKPITNRDEQTNSMLKIPNPVKNEILVSESEDVMMMQLIAADGQVVAQSQNNNLLLLDKVSNGSYFLKIITNSSCVVQQISVQQ